MRFINSWKYICKYFSVFFDTYAENFSRFRISTENFLTFPHLLINKYFFQFIFLEGYVFWNNLNKLQVISRSIGMWVPIYISFNFRKTFPPFQDTVTSDLLLAGLRMLHFWWDTALSNHKNALQVLDQRSGRLIVQMEIDNPARFSLINLLPDKAYKARIYTRKSTLKSLPLEFSFRTGKRPYSKLHSFHRPFHLYQ